MSVEMKFFIYLLECYACHKNRPTGEILQEWDAHGITQEIYDGYLEYHTERIENAYADIDHLLAAGEKKIKCMRHRRCRT